MLEFGASKMKNSYMLTSDIQMVVVVRREDNVKQLTVECRYNEKSVFQKK
jgi:hypothetical protein